MDWSEFSNPRDLDFSAGLQINAEQRESPWKFEEAEMPSTAMMEVSGDGLYHCPQTSCSSRKGFRNRSLLRKHLLWHKKPVKCNICQHVSGTQRDMRRHAERAHKTWAEQHWNVERIRCEMCSDSFTRKDSLQRHYRRKHPKRLAK
ncbi:uncharacterized protein BJX67DRAFT_342239 [Aspergillus lucknowensis]|uniref:C2H2-type domain-containing protein n=1 Tax=Aspergillus lucknowensis TaxID=176173 RepID=A0ABR4M4E4_9EURO